MTGAVRHYSELAHAPIVTADVVQMHARAALQALAARASIADGGPMPGDRTWTHQDKTRHGTALVLTCTGPDLPDDIPGETIRPGEVGRQIPWAGIYRLAVRAPLPVFDLYWKPAEPLRILQFSRGDWEEDLRALAKGRAS